MAKQQAMVSVAQLVERQTVDLDVAGSNPVAHPNIPKGFTQEEGILRAIPLTSQHLG